ncbi:MAG: hypothetical protein RIG61_00175 [Deltaproteobacteria bacterium]
MERLSLVNTVLTGALFGAFMLFVFTGTGYAQNDMAPAEPVGMTCASQEGISCSERCGPARMSAVEAAGVEVVEMAESQQMSMLAGRPLDFTARCMPGYIAIGGGYSIVPDGSTINMKEVRVSSSMADNTNPSGWTGWKVSVFRNAGAGAPDNCLKVEVRAYCVKGGM